MKKEKKEKPKKLCCSCCLCLLCLVELFFAPVFRGVHWAAPSGAVNCTGGSRGSRGSGVEAPQEAGFGGRRPPKNKLGFGSCSC